MDSAPIVSGNPLVQFNLRLDSYSADTSISRFTFNGVLGTIGGITGFYSRIIGAILAHFTTIDYLTYVIKKLFLEKVKTKSFYK